MHQGARGIVLAVFVLLGLSFAATTAVLIWEFRDHAWLDFLTMDSHLFLFFPTFGIVALIAFYLPACAFVDLYWSDEVLYGRWRFLFGLAVVALTSYAIAQNLLSSENRPVWDVAPAVLDADLSVPAGCGTLGKPCERLSILDAVHNLRVVSTRRVGLSKLVRRCDQDPLIEPTPEQSLKRLCIASTRYSEKVQPELTSDTVCCRVQQALLSAVNAGYKAPNGQSLTGKVHGALLPLKVFFLLILLLISLLLAGWSHTVHKRYLPWLLKIEIGVIVGVAAVLMFPLMSQAYLQSNGALMGSQGTGAFTAIVPAMSLAFGVWTLFIVLYFWRRQRNATEMMFKIGGAAAGVVAIIKYDELVSILVFVLGSGANTAFLAGLIALSFILGTVLVSTALSKPLPGESAAEMEASQRDDFGRDESATRPTGAR